MRAYLGCFRAFSGIEGKYSSIYNLDSDIYLEKDELFSPSQVPAEAVEILHAVFELGPDYYFSTITSLF
mgnify:CR=1 FL=1